MNELKIAGFETAVLVLLTLSRGAESRKKILLTLLSGPKNCRQISQKIGLDWWTVQKHLRLLLKENIVNSSDFGNSKFYKLTPKGEAAIKAILSEEDSKKQALR